MASGEHQHQEASVAGESPDKVEREESSGETAAEGGAVPSTGAETPEKTAKQAVKKPAKKATKRPAKKNGTVKAQRLESGSDPEPPGEGVQGAGEGSGGPAAPDSPGPSGDNGGNGDGNGGGPGDGKGGDRLKDAVAAWVAGPEDEAAGDAAPENGMGEDRKPLDMEPSAEESKTSQSAPSELPVRPKPSGEERDGGKAETAGSAQAPGTGADKGGTAVKAKSGAGEPRSGGSRTGDVDAAGDAGANEADEADEESAARRSSRATAAFFGVGRRKSEPVADEAADEASDGASDGAASVAESAGREGGGDGPAGDAVDQPTAVFRAPEGKNGTKGKGTGTAEAPEGEPAEGAVDQPTAIFRVPESEKDASDGDDAKGAANAKGAKGGDELSGDASTPARKAPVDPRVAAVDGSAEPPVEREPEKKPGEKPGAKPGKPEPEQAAPAESGSKSKTESEAETQSEAESETKPKPEPELKPEPKPRSKSEPEAESESESESERTSQFVPLKSADAPPRPPKQPVPAVPPKPLGKPHRRGEGEAGETAEQPQPQPQPQPLSEAELTRQQPRPDQEPLDLLAQLTNKPPKRETPLRTVGRRIKIWTPLVLLVVVLIAIAQAVRPLPDPQLQLTAAPSYTFKGAKPSVPWPSEGQAVLDVDGLGSLGSSGKDKPVPVASVAKMMTAYVILRDHPVKKGTKGAVVPVDKKAEDEAGLSAQNESTVKVKQGDKITEREAIQATMIASANNVARLLARWDAGSEKAFTKKMNAAAKQLGMHNTRYTDPSGLTSSTVSTALDQVKLAKQAMDNKVFKSVVRMPGYSDSKGKKHGNWNKLVPLDGVVGIKTGTTTKAGGNLIFAAEKNVGGTKQLIVGAVLGQYKPSILDTVLGASKKLIDTAQDSLRSQKVVRKGDVVGYMDDRLGGRTPVVATKDVTAVGWSGLKVKLALTGGGKAPAHTGSRNDKVGSLTVGHGPGQVRVPVALQKKMEEPGFGPKLTRIL